MSTYIQAAVLYYAYTAITYSFYRSYYISAFTVHYWSGAPADNNTTVITAACSAAAAVVVVALLVVMLIKSRSRKQTSS